MPNYKTDTITLDGEAVAGERMSSQSAARVYALMQAKCQPSVSIRWSRQHRELIDGRWQEVETTIQETPQ